MKKMRRPVFVSVVLRGEGTIHRFCSEMRSIRRSQTWARLCKSILPRWQMDGFPHSSVVAIAGQLGKRCAIIVSPARPQRWQIQAVRAAMPPAGRMS